MQPYNDIQPKGEQIRDMFDTIAPRYDLLNRLMSLGIDRLWRRRVTKMARREVAGKNGGVRILDLATGTGDLAVAMARRIPQAGIVGADVSEGMLSVAAEKVEKRGLAGMVTFEVAAAEQLPFADEGFDAVTAAFGVRNFSDIPQGLREMRRVLRPGGRVYISELSMPRGKIFGALMRFYFRRVIPLMGGRISGDGKAYAYLPDSVGEFPPRERFLEIMRDAGFSNCRATGLTFGFATIYAATK